MTNTTPHKKNAGNLGAHCTAQEAAAYADVTPWTIRQWVKAGRLEAHRPVERGSSRLRIVTASLRKLLGET